MKKIDIANQIIAQIHKLEDSCWADHIDERTMHDVIMCVENVITSWATDRIGIGKVREIFRPLEEYQRLQRKNLNLKRQLNDKNGWHKINYKTDQPDRAGYVVWLSIKHKDWVTDKTETIEAFTGYGDFEWYVCDKREVMENPGLGVNRLSSKWIPLAWKEKDYYKVEE